MLHLLKLILANIPHLLKSTESHEIKWEIRPNNNNNNQMANNLKINRFYIQQDS